MTLNGMVAIMFGTAPPVKKHRPPPC